MELQISEEEFLVQNYLDVFRIIEDLKPVEKSTGLKPEKIKECLLKLAEKNLVMKEVKEKVEKWRITAKGEVVVKSYRQSLLEKTGRKDVIMSKFEEFENVYNTKFKELATAWQVKIVGGRMIINDHSDPEYDAKILNQLFELHERVVKVIKEIADAIPMFKTYITRLHYAIKKIKEERNYDYFIRHEDSYHNVWFELHEVILRFWGRERRE